MELFDLLKIVFVVVFLFFGALVKLLEFLAKLKTHAPDRATRPPVLEAQTRALPATSRVEGAESAESAQQRAWSAMRGHWLEVLSSLEREALALGEDVEHERPNRRFQEVLTQWLPQRSRQLHKVLKAQEASADPSLIRAARALLLVLAEVKELIAQRRSPVRAGELGDADTLAMACYEPIIQFAQAEGIALASAWPATQLTPVNLAIWTGFSSTSVAPIFLPPDFFEHLVHWPAIAHEIGHDFLISVIDLDKNLRAELGVASEASGRGILRVTPHGVPQTELERLMGAWFEELFCDLFGTLMCGPGYVATMCEQFAAVADAREVLWVGLDGNDGGNEDDGNSGRYDVHPPAHLRVHVGCWALQRAGHTEMAATLWANWKRRHGFGSDEGLVVPTRQGTFGFAFDVFTGLVDPLLERLYAGPLACLSGVGLADISGLDFGPHAAAEGQRAKEAFLAARLPTTRDVRAIINGAVLAWLEQPEQETRILAAARTVIPALGTGEQRPEAAAQAGKAAAVTQGRHIELTPRAFLEAMLVDDIIGPPRSTRTPSGSPRSRSRIR